jgi:hypothetical protein
MPGLRLIVRGTHEMRIEAEQGGCSIVLLGGFNPTIFTPEWFARYEIATEAEKNDSTVNIIHPEISNFKLGSKLILVDLTRFSVESTEAPWIALMDFVTKTFGQFLSHTPINRVGINRHVHFGVGSEENRNRIGRLLAPTSVWGEWGKRINSAPQSQRGGFTNLTMRESREGGWIQATVQPSVLIKGNSGIFVNVNDDYILSAEETKNASAAMQLVSKVFDVSVVESEWIIDQLMALAS